MSFVAVLPSIHSPYTWTCLRSMHPAFRARTMVAMTAALVAWPIFLAGHWLIGRRR